MTSMRISNPAQRLLAPLGLALALVGLVLTGPAQAFDRSEQSHPVDLKPEIQGTMFQGTIEAIDRAGLSLTVKTDFGRVLSLLLPNPKALRELHKGDRVRLEADGQGLLSVRKLIPHDVPLTQGSKPAGRST